MDPTGYCSWDGEPAFYTFGKAWVFRSGKWVEANSWSVGHEARAMTKEAFEKKFGQLPPPPHTLRNAGDDRS
jgi:hypothetical protein